MFWYALQNPFYGLLSYFQAVRFSNANARDAVRSALF